MTTGYFLSRNHWAGVGRQLKKLCLLYGVCILLYLPVNLYAGSFTGPADVCGNCWWTAPSTTCGISRRPFWASSSPGGSAGWACGWLCLWRRYSISSVWAGTVTMDWFPRSRCFGPFTTAFLHCAAIPAMACSSRHCSFCLGPPEGGGTKSCLWRASSSLWQP